MAPLVYVKIKTLLERMSSGSENANNDGDGGGGQQQPEEEGNLFRERMALVPEMYEALELRTRHYLACLEKKKNLTKNKPT
jgi:hypothetical protein